MDSGLSNRADRALKDILPKGIALEPPKNYNATTAIDLSNAQNEVLRSEVGQFFKTAIESNLISQSFDMPPSNGGEQAVREAMASFFNRYFNPIHPVLTEQIVLTAGASDAIENVIHSICDEGDSVIIPGPYWHGFDPILTSRANVNILVAHSPTYQNYDNYLLPSLLAAYNFADDRSRIKAVLLCNPNNPLSRCYPKRTLVEVMEFCQERGLHLVSDELYALTTLQSIPDEAPTFVSALSLTEPLVPEGAVKVDPSRVHVVWSASKLFGCSGLRIGCLISQQNPALCKAMSLLTAHHTNSIASLFLTSLLTWHQLPTLISLNSERLTASYRILAAALENWGVAFVAPTHGILLFARLGMNVKSAVEERAYFNRLAVMGVRVGAGRFYNGVEGEFGWARVRFSVPVEVMRRAVERIGEFLVKEGQ
ncbi:PLP-dependent transferase [Aaosphaeria arxii CBS 175.79]|uniref:PLP-dependent transferase n=1 Tax=Aaosphaeria arxii CBS 175.79 TaxID=1450172 RepID=A0A6A5XQ62_9PLEO|nr:PLP-dependent transferase [Aaosphaeria arxii CBS 175.79]KAF2015415.1 PLP-dependent transferase [Aaosphaeria arxii CBS 175.79]